MTEKRTIPLEGLPDKYDPEAVSSSLRQAFQVVEGHLEAVAVTPPATDPVSTRAARFDDVRRIALTYQGGPYGSAADPRIAMPTVDGAGVSQDGYTQRFRFDVGTELKPLLRFHIRNPAWAHDQSFPEWMGEPGISMVSFGHLVPGIRHDLARVPEFCTRRASSSRAGPVGQVVAINGGPAGVTIGAKVRCHIDFMPLFGVTAQDIELQLKGLLQFTSGDHAFDDLGGAIPDASTFENPLLLKGYASDLVTTESQFGGLLIATIWGIPTLQAMALSVDVAGQVAHFESSQSWTRDPSNGNLLDQNAVCAVRDFGSLYGMRVIGLGNLASLQSAGLKLTITRGSVDFVLE